MSEFNKINFQAESKKSGDEFEDLVQQDLLVRGFGNIKKDHYVAETGCEVDFLAYTDSLEIELVESKGGKPGIGKRPGAKRTDNVKKAIANGALIKTVAPHLKYVVYFSSEPEPRSYSDEMIKTALKHKIIDEVRYISY